jgi:acyl dehydratase
LIDEKFSPFFISGEDVMFDKDMLGKSFPPFTIVVEHGKIHEMALAIGDLNPIYHSREAAQAAGHQDVPLSPTMPTVFSFWGNERFGSQLASAGINVMRILHGEEEYDYLAPIFPGDVLTGVVTIIEGKNRQGRDGSSMDIVTTETRYTNQSGEPVLNARTTIVVRE